jgi:uncharacterized membrane protein
VGIILSIFGGLVLMIGITDVLGSQYQSGLVRVEQEYIKQHQQPLPNIEFSEGVRHLMTAFRLSEPSALSERIQRMLQVTGIYLDAPLPRKLTGLGYGVLENGVGTSFNAYIDSVVRFGLIHLVLLLFFFTMLAYRLYQRARINATERDLAIFGIVVLGYAVTFALNMSILHPVFFNISSFCFVIASVAGIMCDSKTNMIGK